MSKNQATIYGIIRANPGVTWVTIMQASSLPIHETWEIIRQLKKEAYIETSGDDTALTARVTDAGETAFQQYKDTPF